MRFDFRSSDRWQRLPVKKPDGLVKQTKTASSLHHMPLLLFIGVVGFLVMIIVTLFVVKQSSPWKEDTPLGVAVITPIQGSEVQTHVSILWMDPNTREALVLELPDNLVLSSPIYGQYPVSSLYGLYAIDKQPARLLLFSLSTNIGIDVSHLIVSKSPISLTKGDVTRMYRQLMTNREGKTTMSFPLIVSAWSYLKSIEPNKFISQTIESRFLVSQQLNDQEVLVLERIGFDRWLEKKVSNAVVKKEALPIAIVNVSGKQKAATTLGRFFTNMGFLLLSVGDMAELNNESQIFVRSSELLPSETVRVLSRYLQTEPKTDVQITKDYRADIVIFIGKNEAKSFTP